MDASSRSPLPCLTCFRVKSWRNLWLSVEPGEGRPAAFVRQEEESSAVALVPSLNGLYMLQLILPRPLSSSSADSASAACPLASSEEHASSSGNAGWFLRPCGHSVVAAWNDFGSASPNFRFRLEFDENGWVRFRGNDDGYLSSDNDGHLRSGIRKPKKWESFQLYENLLPGGRTEALVHAPVRVNLKAHTGKYLCAAKPVVSALAEAPCCCEEFLLDLSFPPLSPPLAHREARNSEVEDNQENQNKYCKMQHREECRIRTSDGLCNLSAEADGMLSTVPVDQLQGKESFFIELFYQRGQPIVHIRHGNGNVQQKHYPLYVTAEQSGKLACNKSIKRKWEEFGLELANSSRVLIRSVHGGFLACALNLEREISRHGRHQSGNGYSDRKSEQLCSCTLDSRKDMEKIGAWRLTAHGDSLFTVVAMPTPKNGSDSYLFADATGRILQSSEPAVHFPATASLFEIKPATTACIIDSRGHSGLHHHSSRSIVGFTIRTVKKIRGKQRYLSAEPNGTLSASRTQVSRWEIFQLIDVDATAAVSSQPACGKLNIQVDRRMCSSKGHLTVLPNAGWRDAALSVSLNASATAQSSQTTAGGRLFHSDSLKWVSGVSAEALNLGRAVPKNLPSTLQELCIRRICLQACEGSDLLLPISNTNDIAEYDLTRIPEDMLSRIRNHLQARKHPEHSCKMSPITYAAHDDYGVQNYRNGVHGQAVMSQHSNWVSSDEGWHCGTCGQVGILSMDPSINPAHYRYLEAQYRAQNGFVQPTGILWNLISFVGVSVMSTALLFQIFADSGGRRSGHTSR